MSGYVVIPVDAPFSVGPFADHAEAVAEAKAWTGWQDVEVRRLIEAAKLEEES